MINEYEGSSQIDPELIPFYLAANDDDETEPPGSTEGCDDEDEDEDDDEDDEEDDGQGHGH